MKRVLVIAVVIAAVAGTAEAAIINFAFPIDGLQPVPPTFSPGLGVGTVTLDTATNVLSWNITFASMTGVETATHFHGPAPAGANAGVRLPLALGSPKIGNAVISPAFATEVQNHLWYVNIHSTSFPGGEIRGQVAPEPTSLVLLCVGGLALLRRRTNR